MRAESMSVSLRAATSGAAHTGSVESHEEGAIERGRRGVNQARDLIGTPDDGQAHALLGKRQFVPSPWLVEDREEEEAQGLRRSD